MINEAVPSACLFASGLTFGEFVAQAPRARLLFQLRYQEARIGRLEQDFLVSFPDAQNWAVIVAEDSPDTVVVLPILQRIAEANPRAELRIFDVDNDLQLFESLLDEAVLGDSGSDGEDDASPEIDTPLLLILDEEYQLLGQWGPRPQAAEARLDSWLNSHSEYEVLAEDDSEEAQLAYGQLLDELTLEMRVWYNSGLTRNCVEEVVALLKEIQSNEEEIELE